MAEYIEREALISKIVNTPFVVNCSGETEEYKDGMLDGLVKKQNNVIDMIQKQPAADVVEVVRCKDCKYYQEGKLLAPNKFCFRLRHPTENRQVGYNFSDNDFCSYGERK